MQFLAPFENQLVKGADLHLVILKPSVAKAVFMQVLGSISCGWKQLSWPNEIFAFTLRTSRTGISVFQQPEYFHFSDIAIMVRSLFLFGW